MHTDRFVVFKFQDEWLVTYADREQSAFATRQDAERSAFDAADTLASHGHAVSVLIIPDAAGDASTSCFSAMGTEKKSLN
ncbi:hypothetical protein [Microvirga lotononidis]|uniref:DUF2188 domain-containing protein n=1 Tax=Microvirga lotononidis TaxID=864069 RepID=I4YKK9_9HYPH|nr:hypothetical protein [Microvirga lotononidis]EIM24501.1 hypothetical protein MicloDRAFT_00052140 [Microvirga lotononidis]WQO26526.1 hypothetical protein U0023_17805 [Microvirga lotononidis]